MQTSGLGELNGFLFLVHAPTYVLMSHPHPRGHYLKASECCTRLKLLVLIYPTCSRYSADREFSQGLGASLCL